MSERVQLAVVNTFRFLAALLACSVVIYLAVTYSVHAAVPVLVSFGILGLTPYAAAEKTEAEDG